MTDRTTRGPGRPKKLKSSAVLVRRLQVLFAEDDVARLDELMRATNAPSWGAAIRAAIRHWHEDLSKNNDTS